MFGGLKDTAGGKGSLFNSGFLPGSNLDPDFIASILAAANPGGPESGYAIEESGAVPGGPAPSPVPDYAGHYRLHGLNPDGSRPKKHRSTGDKILRTIGHGLRNYAVNTLAANGNPYPARALAERRAARREREAQFKDHDRIVRAMMGQGMRAEAAELAALNPERFGAEFNTRFRSDVMAPGHTRYTPGLGGGAATYAAPETFKNGADVMRMDWNQGGMPGAPMLGGGGPAPVQAAGPPGMRTVTMRSEAEQYADSLGLARGSADWKNAARDFILKSYGPSAERMQGARLAQSNINNRRSTSTSEANNIRSTTTSRDNNIRSTTVSSDNSKRSAETTRGSHSYRYGGIRSGGRGGRRAKAVNPATGETVELVNGKWVPVR